MATAAQVRAEKDREMTEFRQKVVEVARRYAEDNGWCNKVDQALREMGLGDLVGPSEVRITVRINQVQNFLDNRGYDPQSPSDFEDAVRNAVIETLDEAGADSYTEDYEVLA